MKISKETLEKSLKFDSRKKNYEKTLINSIALQMHGLSPYDLDRKIRVTERLIEKYRRNKGYYSNVKHCRVNRSNTSNRSILL